MLNETALREVLLVLTEHAKTQQDVLSHVMDEVAALRETVRGLDPTFDEVFRSRKSDLSSVQLRQLAAEQYADLIRQLKSGLVC
jgi:hypothetical protein